MSRQYIKDYYAEIARLRAVSGSENETVLRTAFQKCLTKYCARFDLTLIPELRHKTASIPDATVKDSLRLTWGYWEAKDIKDDIDREISKKLARGYPTSNIIFENSQIAVLIQHGEEVQRVEMQNAAALNRLLETFLKYEPPAIANFRQAIAQFETDLPNVIDSLRVTIDHAHQQQEKFRTAADEFLALCQKTINPAVQAADVREMLIQHILTKDIFLKVFGEDQFHKENNIANRLDSLEETFFTGGTKRATVERLKSYYSAISVAANSIDNHAEKQQFLKTIYQQFYKIYNPKAADRLGVVYTPNEIVDFMIKATDALVKKHFGRHLYHKNVQILDPAAGTGTFITDLIEFMPRAHIAYKYQHEIHANEVSILPYYIANLNIEYTYQQKTGDYQEFPNICFVDTLDNLSFKGKGQDDIVDSLSHENYLRVKRQNQKPISVIIGNPPYNANQRNWNNKNANRKYPEIDARIKSTYVKYSTAQKTKQYDMYKRFIRWASDRLSDNGVLAFITNRSYLDAKQDDGFRRAVLDEFSEIYVLDLGGDIRAMPGAHNVFGIMTGVAIGFFVKQENRSGCEIYYAKRGDYDSAADKLSFLADTNFSDIHFEHIIPDRKHNWLHQTENDFEQLLCVADKQTKLAQRTIQENAIFKLFCLGASTNRDEWVYDLDKTNLRKKVRFFADTYNGFIQNNDESFNTIIKWSRDLRNQFKRRQTIKYNKDSFITSLYRPYVKKHHFADFVMNDVLTKNHYEMFGEKLNNKNNNKVICFSGISSSKPFQVLAVGELLSLDFLEKTQCLPLYRYDKQGKRHCNITNWGVQQFREQYANPKITAEDIFHYTYAVLHNPAYRETYAINLTREFPRVPFYPDFTQWVQWGKQLMKLHLDYEKQPPYALTRQDLDCNPGGVKLKTQKTAGLILVDAQTTLSGIPPAAWQYQLGVRSALEWVLDQYKEKQPRDPTIAEQFNPYRFAAHKEAVINLLRKVCTVSVQTMAIVQRMQLHAQTTAH